MVMHGKGEPPDLDPFRPPVWNGMADISNPWHEMAQIMYIMTVSRMGVPHEHVGKAPSCGDRGDDLSERRKSLALLADCSAVRRGVR